MFPFSKDASGLSPFVKIYCDIVYAIKSSCYFPVSSADHKCTLTYSSVTCLEWTEFPNLGNLGQKIGSSKHSAIVTASTGSSSGPVFNWRLVNISQSPKVHEDTCILIFNKIFILPSNISFGLGYFFFFFFLEERT